MIYGFILILILSLNIIFSKIHYTKVSKILYLFIIGMIFTWFASIRGLSVGADTELYFNMYLYGYGPFEKGFNGFYGLAQISKFLGGDYRLFLTLTAIILNYSLMLLIYRSNTIYYKEVVYSYFALTYYVQSFNITRQLIAVVLVLLALTYFFDRKYLKSIFIFIIAISFHVTAILGLGLIFIRYLNISKKSAVVMAIFSFSIGSLFNIGFNIFASIFPRYNAIYNNDWSDKSITAGGVGLRVTVISIILIILTIMILMRSDTVKLAKEDIFFKTMVISVYCSSFLQLSLRAIPNFDRAILYYSFGIIFLLPYAFQAIINHYKLSLLGKSIINLIGYSTILGIFMGMYILNNWGEFLPYITIFNHK